MLLPLSPISLLWLCSFLLTLTITSSNYYLQPIFTTSMFLSDSFSYWLSYVTLVVVFTSMMVHNSDSFKFSLFLISVGLASLGVFMTSNLFLLYVFFESSLIPIVYIIMVWGSYPDRGVSSIMMILYTSMFSVPLMSVLFYYSKLASFSLALGYSSLLYSSGWAVAIIMLAFSVKLPMYGVHFWLPMAHVEAPTSGSMILAGVLLKLGGCGLYRFSMIFSLHISRCVILSYCLLCTLLVSFVAFTQSDLKRLVAYSSVVHMSILVVAFLSFNSLSISSFLLIMVCHGFSSPMMFLLVGSIYKLTQTRMLSLIRGIMLYSPMMLLFITLSYLSNIPTPPFSSFLAEIMLFLSVYNLSSLAMTIFILTYAFAAVVFNTYWYTSVSFGPPMTSSTHLPMPFSDFASLVTLTFNLVLLIPLVYMF